MFSAYAGNTRSSCLFIGAVASYSTHAGLQHLNLGSFSLGPWWYHLAYVAEVVGTCALHCENRFPVATRLLPLLLQAHGTICQILFITWTPPKLLSVVR